MTTRVEPIEFERLSPVEAQTDFPELWLTVHNEFPQLTDDDRAKIVSLVVGTCGTCHSRGIRCHCWNDE